MERLKAELIGGPGDGRKILLMVDPNWGGIRYSFRDDRDMSCCHVYSYWLNRLRQSVSA